MSEEKTPPWKSFMFALCGAGAIYSSLMMAEVYQHEKSSSIIVAIWGTCFWVGGLGNLFVDRRLQREARKR